MSLDIAKDTTGWAVVAPGEKWHYGHFSPASWAAADEGRNLDEFYRSLQALYAEHAFTNVVYEGMYVDTAQFNPSFNEVKLWLLAIALLFCHRAGLPPIRFLTVNDWRHRAYGTAVAPAELQGKKMSYRRTLYWKNRAVRWCFDRRIMVENHDEAEAIIIGDVMCQILDDTYAARSGPLFRRLEHQADRARLVR